MKKPDTLLIYKKDVSGWGAGRTEGKSHKVLPDTQEPSTQHSLTEGEAQ